MKRFHIHVGVKNLKNSVQFYSTLFGQQPTKLKDDYAKWMLEDPKVNFAISTRSSEEGVDHLGIQVEEGSELAEITERLKKADLGVYDEGATTCCYAESNKAWTKDPSGIAWEAYQTMADVDVFNTKDESQESEGSSCCGPNEESSESESSCC
jgi:catechol-2,3-dioxygenase